MQEACVVRRPSVISQDETPLSIEPRESSFDHPAVASQSFFRLNATASDTVLDAARSTGVSTLSEVVALVGMGLDRTVARPTRAAVSQGRNCFEHLLEQLTVVDVRLGQADGEWNALGVDHNMTFAARTALVRRVRAGDVAPLFAATVELSMATRSQSISSAHANCCKRTAGSRRQIPRLVHVRNRRQHVDPLPHPISKGRSCHGRPVRSTNRMPVNTCLLLTRGRPPVLPGFRSLGSIGATTVHSVSSRRGFMRHGRSPITF